jgi:hypothetical protein
VLAERPCRIIIQADPGMQRAVRVAASEAA